MDISKNMIDHIARVAEQEKITNLKAVLGDPHSPKLEPNTLDLVCIIDSYHHFEFPQDMLREIKKALRPDGTLVLIHFKRIDGVSKEYILKMVRAGEGTFSDEADVHEYDIGPSDLTDLDGYGTRFGFRNDVKFWTMPQDGFDAIAQDLMVVNQ